VANLLQDAESYANNQGGTPVDARDLDLLARVIGTACTRRRVVKALAATAVLAVSGRNERLRALAAGLSCCKCSGTRACEDDVSSYGECKQLCGTKQAIFSPNYTCQPGKTVSKVCKPKSQTPGFAHLADVTGLYDLAFADATGAATLTGYTQEVGQAVFTAEAAIAAGFAREEGAAILFDGGVQAYRAIRRNADRTLTVTGILSQHETVDAARTWREYSLPQLCPQEAADYEEFNEGEIGNVDEWKTCRFPFTADSNPGVLYTRLMTSVRSGEFVVVVSVDGADRVPQVKIGREYAEAVVDVLANLPDRTESLAPYVPLPDSSALCLPAIAARGAVRAFPTAQGGACDPNFPVSYPVLNGVFTPTTNTPPEAVAAQTAFYDGATTSLTYTLQITDQVPKPTIAEGLQAGNQVHSLTMTYWGLDPTVIDDGGRIFAERRDALDQLRGLRRGSVVEEGGIINESYTTFAFPFGNQTVYGAEKVVFGSGFSFSYAVFQIGEPIHDFSNWNPATDPATRGIAAYIGRLPSVGNLDAVQLRNLAREAFQHPLYGLGWR
jgi:hypothetical protein